MKEKRECKVVQDLLPNYIEKVTSEETNQYIEEHIQNCEECKKVYSNMTKEDRAKVLETDQTVDYMKKVNRKIKIAKIALGSIAIMILLAMTAFGANTLRNYRILEELRENLKETAKISNYHQTMGAKFYNNGLVVQDVYVKDGKYLSVNQNITVVGQKYKISFYYNGNRMAIYKEGNNGGQYEKTVEVDENYQPTSDIKLSNWFLEEPETEGGTSKLWLSMRLKIEKVTYNGKECYMIENNRFIKDTNQHIIYYIEKDTGLLVRQVQHDGNTTDHEYEFGNVQDEIFEEPNIEEYQLIENK